MDTAFEYKDNEIFAFPERVTVPGLENIQKDFKNSEWLTIRFNNATKDSDLKECLKSIDIEEKAKYDEYVKNYPYWELPPKDKDGFYNRDEWLARPENKHLKDEREKQIRERDRARHEYKKKHKDCPPEERKKLHVDRVYEQRKIKAEKLLKHRPCKPDPFVEPAYNLSEYVFPKYTVQITMPIDVIKTSQHIMEIFEIVKDENPENIAPIEVYYNSDSDITRVYTEYQLCLLCIWMYLDYYYIEAEKLQNPEGVKKQLKINNKPNPIKEHSDEKTETKTERGSYTTHSTVIQNVTINGPAHIGNVVIDGNIGNDENKSGNSTGEVKTTNTEVVKTTEEDEFIILKELPLSFDPLPNQLLRSADAVFAGLVKMRYDWVVIGKVADYLNIPWLSELSIIAQAHFVQNLKDRVRFLPYHENEDGTQPSYENDGWDLNNREHLRWLTREHSVHRFDDPASQLAYNDHYDIVKWDDETESTWSDSESSDLTESSEDENDDDENVKEMVGKQTAPEIIDD